MFYRWKIHQAKITKDNDCLNSKKRRRRIKNLERDDEIFLKKNISFFKYPSQTNIKPNIFVFIIIIIKYYVWWFVGCFIIIIIRVCYLNHVFSVIYSANIFNRPLYHFFQLRKLFFFNGKKSLLLLLLLLLLLFQNTFQQFIFLRFDYNIKFLAIRKKNELVVFVFVVLLLLLLVMDSNNNKLQQHDWIEKQEWYWQNNNNRKFLIQNFFFKNKFFIN